ncbi:MAG: aspartyl protease family protein [Verrucomicrobiales bacterium]
MASRDQVLRERGYIPLPLDRVEGDVRFSREFLVSGTPMRLLIDSGANSTDVDGRKADLAGVKRLRSVSVVSRGALGREVKSGYGIGILQAGPVVAENFPFTLAPSGMRPTATSLYEGQIGLDGLSALSALVDIPRASLWVPGPDSVQARSGRKFPLGPLAGLGMKVLRLERAGRLPHLVLEGQLNGQPVSWVVDTGAEVSVMAAESFARFGLPSRRSDARIIDAAGDRIGIRHATLENVTFGDVIVRRFDIAVASLSQVRDVFRDSRGRPIDGILGMDFLTGGSALLDSESRLLYLVQN